MPVRGTNTKTVVYYSPDEIAAGLLFPGKSSSRENTGTSVLPVAQL
jgi:hypothetical protein